MTASVPPEAARLKALRECSILDTPPESAFDDLAKLASAICRTPIALVSLVDSDRQWFKARVGLDRQQTPRNIALCSYAIQRDEPLIVEDATKDDLFRDNPLVTSEPGLRFYAGFPVRVEGRHRVGTLCVLDTRPRTLDDVQLTALATLADQVSSHLDLRRTIVQLGEAQKNLVCARDAAEAASRAKSAFLANMSHEIRTPLTAIVGFADLLADGAVSGDEAAEAVRTIRRGSRHLIDIINAVLDLSKIEAGHLALEPQPTDVRALLDDVQRLVRSRAREKGLHLSVSVATEVPPKVLLDPTRLRQVIVNLLENALKFTDSGSVSVRASMAAVDALSLAVQDTGIGINSELLARVFLPFEQGDSSSTRRYSGTGLGLAICRELVQAMGGELRVESTPGEGSTFALTVRAIPVASPPSVRVHARAEPVSSRPLAGRRVLIVEDGLDNQRLLRFLMTRAGASVELAENGQVALDAVCGTDTTKPGFDVILMDMQMPVVDGYDATRILRARGVTTPILALTADAVGDARHDCLEAGCSAFMSKPIERVDLERACAALIDASAENALATQPTG